MAHSLAQTPSKTLSVIASRRIPASTTALSMGSASMACVCVRDLWSSPTHARNRTSRLIPLVGSKLQEGHCSKSRRILCVLTTWTSNASKDLPSIQFCRNAKPARNCLDALGATLRAASVRRSLSNPSGHATHNDFIHSFILEISYLAGSNLFNL